jgi:hypothetical protein
MSEPIMTICNKIEKNQINLNPNFQRGYIWSDKFKDELIASIIQNYPIGNIIFFIEKATQKLLVVDGQQRLKTIYSFIDKKYPRRIRDKDSITKISRYLDQMGELYSSFLKPIDMDKITSFKNRKSFIMADLPDLVKDNFLSYNLNTTTMFTKNSENIVEYFKYVQNQEKLRAGEIINSFQYNNDDLFDLLSDTIQSNLIASYLGITNKRNEITKHFINIIGMLTNKLNFNASEKDLISFAKNFSNEILNEKTLIFMDNIKAFHLLFNEDDSLYLFDVNIRQVRKIKLFFVFLIKNRLNKDNIDNFSRGVDYLVKNNKEYYDKVFFIESGFHTLNEIEIVSRYLGEIIENVDNTN